MADATTLDDRLMPKAKKTTVLEDIGDLILTFPETVKNAAKVAYHTARHTFNYGLLTGAGYLSSLISGPAGPVTAGAMMTGRVLVDRKKGEKTDFGKLYKEGWKGLILGNLAKYFYQYVISAIPNQTLYGKVGRALAYNPGFIGGIYNPVYLKATEMLEGKTPEKGEWAKLTKKIFRYNSPFHFLTTNYIDSVQQQVAASAGLGTAYRILVG